ncbi:hypothetical protein LWI29_028437 [Acer saccharum]|uniref:Uncharacterized protein n=1 Tax=Acer saccharum TaxID=4024 RepID=A0AA39W2M8_ACESA|nr:hypothetical protein LWI29_028437 [Acer saccharum]
MTERGWNGVNAISEKEDFQTGRPAVGVEPTLSIVQVGKIADFKFESRGSRELIGRNRSVRDARVFVVEGVLEKGKRKWVSKKVKRKLLPISFKSGKLNLEKRRGNDRVGRGYVRNLEDSSSSSSEVDANKKVFLDSLSMRGECSKKVDTCPISGSIGLSKLSRPKKVSFITNDTDAQLGKDGLEICVDLGLVEVCSAEMGSIRRSKSDSFGLDKVVNDDINLEAQFVKESGVGVLAGSEYSEKEDSNKSAALEVRDSEEEMVNATVPIEKEGACIEGDKEDEMMNVIVSFKKEKAGIEFLREEVLVQASKAAEKMREVIPMVDDVVELSSKKGRRNVNSISKHKMVTRFSKHHCLDSDPVEAEVVKVLEIGAAIGFDFSGIEKEVAEVIAVREKEDDARFEAM